MLTTFSDSVSFSCIQRVFYQHFSHVSHSISALYFSLSLHSIFLSHFLLPWTYSQNVTRYLSFTRTSFSTSGFCYFAFHMIHILSRSLSSTYTLAVFLLFGSCECIRSSKPTHCFKILSMANETWHDFRVPELIFRFFFIINESLPIRFLIFGRQFLLLNADCSLLASLWH